MSSKTQVSPEQLEELLARGGCELIDVREPVEWAHGRIAGARHVPLGDLDGLSHGDVAADRPVVVMCRSGQRGARAAALLRERGFADVSELAGGLLAWEAAGLATERDERAPWALERQTRLAAGALVLLGLALSLVWPPAIALSWFVGAGLVFAGLTDWCGMGLLLARAPWNRRRPRMAASGGLGAAKA